VGTVDASVPVLSYWAAIGRGGLPELGGGSNLFQRRLAWWRSEARSPLGQRTFMQAGHMASVSQAITVTGISFRWRSAPPTVLSQRRLGR
jgi:hypothetical protein